MGLDGSCWVLLGTVVEQEAWEGGSAGVSGPPNILLWSEATQTPWSSELNP